MADILWIQTEKGTSFWKNGCPTTENLTGVTIVYDNPNFILKEESPFRIYWNRFQRQIVIEGNLVELDALQRRIPFSFFMDGKDVYKLFDCLKKRLNGIGFSLLESEVNQILSQYVRQRFFPFLGMSKFLTTPVIGKIVIWILTNFSRFVDFVGKKIGDEKK